MCFNYQMKDFSIPSQSVILLAFINYFYQLGEGWRMSMQTTVHAEFSVKLLLSLHLCGAPGISSGCGGNHLYPMGHPADTRFSYVL